MRTLGAHFAEAIDIQLYLSTEGARSERIPGALIVLEPGHAAREHVTSANCGDLAPTPARA